jgi:hypothetical protein
MCPNCGAEILSDEFTPGVTGGTLIADCYAACLRRCASCGIGFSNARHAADTVRIYSDPLRNIPEPARAGALDILASALNVRNRANKRSKFGFETSEDSASSSVASMVLATRRCSFGEVRSRSRMRPATTYGNALLVFSTSLAKIPSPTPSPT